MKNRKHLLNELEYANEHLACTYYTTGEQAIIENS